MEPPAKRARIGYAAYDDDDDELNLDPEQLAARQDPGYQLQKSREGAAFRLKSTFESIFEKYERDFTDVGDEIDLRTGEIVVDNGHLRSMQGRDDTGQETAPANETGAAKSADPFRDEDSSDEEDRILHGGTPVHEQDDRALILPPRPPAQDPGGQLTPSWRPPVPSFAGASSRLSGIAFQAQPNFMGRSLSFSPFAPPILSADPMWSAPELPAQTFTSGFRPFSGPGLVKASTTRTVVRRSLPMAVENLDEDDDIILGVVDKPLRTKLATPPKVLENNDAPKEDEADEGERDIVETSRPQIHEHLEPQPQFTHHDSTAVKQPPKKRGRKTLSTLERAPNKLPPTTQPLLAKPPKQKKRPVVVVQSSTDQTQPPAATATAPQDEPKAKRSPSKEQLVIAKPRKRRRAEITADDRASSVSQLDHDTARSPNLPQYGVQSASTAPATVPATVPTTSGPARRLVIELDGRRDLAPISADGDANAGGSAVASNAEKQTKEEYRNPKPRRPREIFTRNVFDASYGFSDEEDGLIKRRPVKPTTQPETNVAARQQTQPVVQDETLLSSRARNSAAEGTQPAPPTSPRKATTPSSNRRKAPDSAASLDTTSQGPSTKQHNARVKQASRTTRTTQANINKDNPQQSSPRRHPRSPKPLQEADANTATAAPSTPKASAKTGSHKPTDSNPPSSSRTGIVSLIIDSDEDELSFEGPSSSVAQALPKRDDRSYSSSAAKPKPPSATRRVLFGSADPNTLSATTGSARKSSLRRGVLLSAQKSGQKRGSAALRASRSSPIVPVSSRMGGERGMSAAPLRARKSSISIRRSTSPTEALIKTPGGSLRRCGEDGFRCERDFCFICL